MKNIPIHVVLPQSLIDLAKVTPLDLAENLSVAYNGRQLSFQVDVVPDDHFDNIHLIP